MSDQPHIAEDNGEVTGRYLMVFHPEGLSDAASMAFNVAGITMPSTAAEAEAATISGEWREMNTMVVPSLGVAVCDLPPEQVSRLETGGPSPIRYIRPEYIFRIAADNEEFGDLRFSPAYVR